MAAGVQPFAWAALVPNEAGISFAMDCRMFHRNILIEQTDPEVWAAVVAENRRQEEHIELIASENYASPAVLLTMGIRRASAWCRKMSTTDPRSAPNSSASGVSGQTWLLLR